MEAKQAPKSDCKACGAPVLERNRYYTGKFMTARDFQCEQEYTRSRQQLHNRLLHGWGVACGLEVQPHRRPDCRSKSVIVQAGVAFDCCGREVILEKELAFEVPRTKPAESRPAEAQPQQEYQTKEPAVRREEWLLCLFYAETPIEFTPALYTESGCETEGEQANRVRDGASLRLLRLADVDESCWQRGKHHRKYREDCDDQAPGPAGSCLEPDCPCGKGIPLALLSFDRDRDDDPILIDTSGRRRLPVPADFLTHIVGTNWEHGGQMTLAHLRDTLNGRLEIRFDRKIRPASENRGVGVSEYTFQVQFGGAQEDVRFLPFPYREPPILVDDHIATFRIDPRYLDMASRDDLKDKMVYITLKCDFIIDCLGIPVDGAHLGGTLPTHSGRMGGDFQSWFYVTEEDEDGRSKPDYSDPDRKPRKRS
jgi:hypothetical protein